MRFIKGRRVLALFATFMLLVSSFLTPGTPAAAAGNGLGRELWRHVPGTPPPARPETVPAVKPKSFQGYRLNRGGMQSLLARAPHENNGRANRDNSLIVSLPNPKGIFEDFMIQDSPVMEAGLAAQHPEIKTYKGRGVDDPYATIRLSITPLGFNASVRSPDGAWYIDPYYQLDESLYASYYGRDLTESPHGPMFDRDSSSSELAFGQAYYHAADPVTLTGTGFAPNTEVTITISDPLEQFSTRTLSAGTDELGSFQVDFVADPDGILDIHVVEATDGNEIAMGSYQVVRDDDPTVDPPTGDVLRTYRLALITDPGYATFFGGSANVTAAKVALMNRVNQVYEDDLSIRMILVNNNDMLNLDTWSQATAPNGACGAAACFTQAQVTGCSSTTRARFVIGQIIGASNYDIGHLALGQPGGGVANLGVIGRSNKAGGCTGIPTPVGDFYAVDYVAHEMGHQFSGNHPFNGNQLNCSGGNRSAATSVEPGSGSSVMAYAGICLTDDLQAHSDPYFSQRSQQEITTYTSSNQAAINEVQTVSLVHFGGGNEAQVVTFGPGYSQAATVQPLSATINAAPSATSRGGAEEVGNTVTIATPTPHTLQVGDTVTISGVGVAGYNGTFVVTAVPTSRSFQYFNPTAGLATSGGGTVTLSIPGATESGTTVTISTSAAHGRSVGDFVTISGVGVAGYNGTFAITVVPTARSFQYTAAASGLANSGGGSATYFSPFQVRINGNDSAVIGGSGLPYNPTNVQNAINSITDFPGTVTVSSATSTGFALTYAGASAGLDVPSIELVNLSCAGCFASVEETNHGGDVDSFRLNYNGIVSAPIVNGTNYSAAGVLAALTPILPAGTTATVVGFAGGTFNNTGFQVTFSGSLAATNVPVMLALQGFTSGASGFVGETDKGGAVDNKGGIVTPTGNTWPAVTVPAQYTIPLRTPFTLTGSATDAQNDPMLFSWEQNDRGGTAGTSLLSNTKTNGPLFAMFPKSGQISLSDALQYNSPGENFLTTQPARTFPDLQQILDNNTNAETGACPTGPIAQPVHQNSTECFAEFLPTTDYVGFTGVNSSPLSLHFRFTARDLNGGNNSGDTTLLLATNAGPFLVTSPNTAVTYNGGSNQTVTWNVANTNASPVNTANVKISLSVDGGYTYPYELAASTANDGSEQVTLPDVGTTTARVKVEAVGNIFFDISNSNFTIVGNQTISFATIPDKTYGDADFTISPTASSGLAVSLAASGQCTVNSAVAPATVHITGAGSCSITASQSGNAAYNPALDVTRTFSIAKAVLTVRPNPLTASRQYSDLNPAFSVVIGGYIPGGDDTLTTSPTCSSAPALSAPGTYPITCSGGEDDNYSFSYTNGTLTVTREDAQATYTGDMLAFTSSSGSTASVTLRATVLDSSLVSSFNDSAPGDIRNATVTFKEGATTLCGPLAVSLLNGATTSGTASCAVSLGLGAHTIDIYVNNYYTATASGLVEVAQPNGSFITGGGQLAISSSAGQYKADTGSIANFGFNVNYRNLRNLQGHTSLIFQAGGHTYQIKSTAINSLGITFKTPTGATCSGPVSSTCFGYADFQAKANLTDITNPLAPISLGGNLTLQVTLTDKGEPGSSDTIAFTVWSGSRLLFSSNWNGAQSVQQLLGGGNLVAH